GREVGWRRRGLIRREKADVPDEHAADDRILARRDRRTAVPADPRQHLFQAGGAIALAEQRPRLRRPHPGEVTVEPAAHHAIVRVMGLEEERLADTERAEPPAAGRPPEVDLAQPRPRGQITVPLAVSHADITAHRRIVHSRESTLWTYPIAKL